MEAIGRYVLEASIGSEVTRSTEISASGLPLRASNAALLWKKTKHQFNRPQRSSLQHRRLAVALAVNAKPSLTKIASGAVTR